MKSLRMSLNVGEGGGEGVRGAGGRGGIIPCKRRASLLEHSIRKIKLEDVDVQFSVFVNIHGHCK